MRGGAAVLVALLMLSTLPVLATAEEGDLRLESTLFSPLDSGWYASGDAVEFVATFRNEGAQTAFENDPSCGTVLQVLNSDSELIVDERSSCRGQSQMIDMAAAEVYEFDALSWDLKGENGQEVLPGWYTVQALHTATGQTVSHEVHLQTNVTVPEALTMTLEATSRLGPLVASEEMVLSVVMHNPTSQRIQLPALGDCLLQLTVNDEAQLLSNCMPTFSQIEAYEAMLIEQVLLPAGTFEAGLQTLEVSLPGQQLSGEISLDVSQAADGFDPQLQNVLSVEITGLGDGLYGDGDILQASMSMFNTGLETQSLRFTDTCRAELWIVNDEGEVVFDSRMFKTCNAINMDYSLEAEETATFSLPDWTFNDLLGC